MILKRKILYITVAVVAIAVCSLIMIRINPPLKYGMCHLHQTAPSGSIELLDINAGTLSELRLYQPHESEAVGLVKVDREPGYKEVFFRRNYTCISHPMEDYADIEIAIETAAEDSNFSPNLYCRKCRKELEPYCEQPFILVDHYKEGNPILYPLTDGAIYHIRHYTLNITSTEKGFQIHMISSYFNERQEE